MSRITIRVDVDLTEGELREFTGNLWSRGEERILSILRRADAGNGVNKRSISQSVGHAVPGAQNRDEILKKLISEGIVEVVSKAVGRKGARYAIRGGRK